VKEKIDMNISQFLHYVRYTNLRLKRKTLTPLKKGMLIASIDLDVGNRKLGEINQGKNDLNVNNSITEYQIGLIEEIAVPLFFKLFDEIQIPVTIAVRGQVLELGKDTLSPLFNAKIKHDIGVHGYSHKSFPKLSYEQAENELELSASLLKDFGIFPKSFIYPRNEIAYLDLLSKFGYQCYRDRGDAFHDGMYIKKQGQIYDIHPSLYINQWSSKTFMKETLNVCLEKKLPMHMWFHLWRFGKDQQEIEKSIKRIFLPFLQYARRKVDNQQLTFETMCSSITQIQQ
jgi:hypothetical protein